MRREHRLQHASEFDHVRARRQSWAHPLLVSYVRARGDDGPSRIGISVSRRVGKATIRNRVKRRIREAARALYPDMRSGRDLVLIARPPAAQASYIELSAALASLLARAGLRRDTDADRQRRGGRDAKSSVPGPSEGET